MTARLAMCANLLYDVRHWGCICCTRKPAGGDGLLDSLFQSFLHDFMSYIRLGGAKSPKRECLRHSGIGMESQVGRQGRPQQNEATRRWATNCGKMWQDLLYIEWYQDSSGLSVYSFKALLGRAGEAPWGSGSRFIKRVSAAFIPCCFMIAVQVFIESYIAKPKDLEAQICKAFSQKICQEMPRFVNGNRAAFRLRLIHQKTWRRGKKADIPCLQQFPLQSW